ncbi:FimV/HubP family polar landmark protein, partial [Pseudoalteromonas sp. S2893]|uniref:FimV/HubP family polar landmark protein n=1 Tax=Pseudoalteromonas sp. S2893 TaxID=579530 RepID=UPI001271B34B
EPELVEEPELDADLLENTDFTDSSETLLDPEDAQEEYTDDTLKSVDELLNELQQATDEDYVENPDWALDDLDDDIEEVEVDLGDDPLDSQETPASPLLDTQPENDAVNDTLSDDIDFSDDKPETLDVTEQQQYLPDELLGDELDGDATGMQPSQAEQDLANALSGSELDSLEDDFDDELLIDNDFSEPELEPKHTDGIGADDNHAQVPSSLDELTDDESELDLSENTDADEGVFDDDLLQSVDELDDELNALLDEQVTPSEELDEYPELELDNDDEIDLDDQQSYSPQELQGDELDGQASGMAPSQAEQDLANALAGNTGVDALEADLDDEPLIDDELDAPLPQEEPLGEAQATDSAQEQPDFDDAILEQALSEDVEDEITNSQLEAELTQAADDQTNEDVIPDEQLDDEFMADLTQTDFDALLSELGEPDELNLEDSSEFDVDFDSLLNEDLDTEVEAKAVQEEPSQSDQQATTDDFVDIDALLEQSDDSVLEHEPYDEVNMDVGLSDFDSLLAGDNPTDVDLESGGYSAKLDLARAYIEIDDFDSALKVIEDVIESGPEDVQEEAQSLKAKLN